MKTSFKSLFSGIILGAATLSSAKKIVPIYGLVELSGDGTTSGINFDNGIKLA